MTNKKLKPMNKENKGELTPEVENKLKEIIFQGMGYVSMCWNPKPSGVFESSLAEAKGNEVTELVLNLLRQPASPVNVEVEKAAEEYAEMEWRGYDEDHPFSKQALIDCAKMDFIAGAKWKERDAVEFVEWIRKKDYRWNTKSNLWYKYGQHDYPEKTSHDLYILFKNKP